MTTMRPVPADDPLMIAWKAYEATDDYANTRRWVVEPHATDGSLWAAFEAGFRARPVAPPPPSVEELERLLDEFRNRAMDVAALEAPKSVEMLKHRDAAAERLGFAGAAIVELFAQGCLAHSKVNT
jgi:hypothetical protein